MKYAMIVALVLLGACAPDDADLAEESATEAATTSQAPLGQQTTVAVADAPVAQPAPVKAAPVINKTFQLSSSGLRPGSDILVPSNDADKPQPQPWVPPDQGMPREDEARTETKAVQGTAQGSAP